MKKIAYTCDLVYIFIYLKLARNYYDYLLHNVTSSIHICFINIDNLLTSN